MHTNGEVECQICDIKFSADALALHERKFHAQPKGDNQCPICKVKVAKFSYLGKLVLLIKCSTIYD